MPPKHKHHHHKDEKHERNEHDDKEEDKMGKDYYDKKDDKKDDKKHYYDKKDDKKKDGVAVSDFAFDTLKPNKTIDNDKRTKIGATAVQLAQVKLDKVNKGNLVWLNGLVGLDNDSSDTLENVIIRIFEGDITLPGKEIYKANIDIDPHGEYDEAVIPCSHVDVIKHDEKYATYTLTVEDKDDTGALKFMGPLTFTALVINKDDDKY